MTAAATLAASGPKEVFRRILRNAGLVLGGKAATALINLAATGIAVRSLGMEAMGVLVLVHAFARTASSACLRASSRSVTSATMPNSSDELVSFSGDMLTRT